MGEVVEFDGVTRLDLDPKKTIEQALEVDLDGIVMIGRTSEGKLYFASSIADGGDVLWLMKIAEKALLE